MRVVEEEKDWSMTRICGDYPNLDGCDVILEIEEDDLSVGRHDGDYYCYFTCSECGKINRIPAEEIPMEIIEWARYNTNKRQRAKEKKLKK